MAHWYDTSASQERKREYAFVYNHLGLTRRLLDAGCSGSDLPINLAEAGFDVWGIDWRTYTNPAGGERGHPRFTFTKGDLRSLPYENNFFDIVLCISTLEHVGLGHWGDPVDLEGDKKAIAELRRVARGELYISVPFGPARIIRSDRIYDQEGIKQLTSGLRIVTEEFWEYNPDQPQSWRESSAEELMKKDNTERYKGIICLELEKVPSSLSS